MIYSVALDGPSGAGKSTIAKRIAKKRDIVYVDTGAMYRAIGLYMLRSSIDTKDVQTVTENLCNVNITLGYEDGTQKIYLNGEDVSRAIRQNEVSMAASNVSAIQAVRTFLLETQRSLAKKQSVIMDGRDIGTVVLPDAEVKIFITADTKVRAERRYKELIEKGQNVDFDTIVKEIEERDYQDSHRRAAPLKLAEGGIMLDTSALGFEESVEAVNEIIEKRIEK